MGASTTAAVRDASRIAVVLAVWSFAYAGYRAYYALGGEVGMIGHPESASEFRALNAFGAAVIFLAGVVPLVAVRVPVVSRAPPTLGWIGAVGCCMHALVDSILRAEPDRTRRSCRAPGSPSTDAGPTFRTCSSTSHGSL